MGTMARTSTAFQLKRLMMLVIWVGRSTPTKGARISSRSRKPAIIIRGRPNEATIACKGVICAFSNSVIRRAGGMAFISSLNLDGLL